ncbi:MAG: TIGR02680 family protein, partial [Mycobacterium sp.]
MTVSDDVFARGQEWLAAALEGGLPEPQRGRWQPLRVGIVGLWEYDDAEFWFADGRLVLRGGNGAGKTKVLELTTLMLLRGEVTPSVLDPFGSQHRTMRFNLLPTGEGDDPRPPADSGLGYAWAEFGRLDDDGEARFFVCGMGMSARRGTGTTGVTTWQFVTGMRPGKELQLMVGGRALEQKELRKLDGVSLQGSASAYRERLARELFGLAAASYDNLTDLLKQLRKPKLGERLSPALLEEALRDALPALATHEVTQLADGWDHLEALRGAVEQTRQAAAAVAQFVREGWRPWARAVLRQRADGFTQATTALDNTTRARNEAQKTLGEAKQRVAEAEGQLATSKRLEGDRDTQLRELLESASYRDAVAASQRVQELRGAVASLKDQVDAAEKRSDTAQQAYANAKQWLAQAEGDAESADGRVAEQVTNVRDAAQSAGLAASAEAHLPGRDLDALLADQQTRLERFKRLGALHDAHLTVERQAEQSGQLVQAAEQDVATARADEAQAAGQVQQAVETLRQQIRVWAEAAVVAICPAQLVEDWCDLVGELTVIEEEAGVARPGPSVVDTVRDHVSGMRRDVADRAEALRLERSPVAARRQEVDSELEQVRARTESPPPAPALWARRERPGLGAELGAPLWRLVNPVDGLDDDVLARLEAAAAASGLLDAWVSADGKVDTVDGRLLTDVQVGVGAGVRGQSLLAVLEPDDACSVEPDVVRGVLAGVAWHDTVPADDDSDWLAADGSWRVGGLTGR